MGLINNFFLDEKNPDSLRHFGFEHNFMIFLTIFGVIALFVFRKRLCKWKYKEKFRDVIAWIFFANMAIYYLVFVIQDVYDWREQLPLHLCFITGFCLIYVLLSQDRKFFRIVYFYTFIGPLPALLIPNIPMRFDRYLTYHFFMSHSMILLVGIYCLTVLGYEIAFRDVVKTFGIGIVSLSFIRMFNIIFGTNYIMSSSLPDYISDIFPFVKNVDFPSLWLTITALIAIIFAYIPVFVLRIKDEKEMVQSVVNLQC